MADYDSALPTGLGDYLRIKAAKEKTPLEDLERRVEIEAIKAEGGAFISGDPRNNAIGAFNEVAEPYDVVVELREGLSDNGLFGYVNKQYVITGTGVKFTEASKE